MNKFRVAVLGAGPAGVCTARALLSHGHKPTLFEAASDFGGLWGANAINHAVYDNLSTNIPTALMEDWSLSFTNDNQSRFVSKDALSNYLQRLSESFDLRAYTRFNTRVTKVTPIDRKPSDMGAWTVQYTTAGTNEGLCKTSTEVFDCVAVATGHYNVPYMPSLPGQEEWLSGGDDVTPRKIMHAMQYRNPSNFSGRSVLVVGMRSSGTDISREISSVVSQLYALDKRCKQVERDGHCIHVPRHCRLREDGRLELPGGGGVIPGKPIDTIVLATGYEFAFEFFDHAADIIGIQYRGQKHVTPLYEHVLHASRPTLGFVGLPQAVPCPVAFFSAQAEFIAAMWSTLGVAGSILPARAEREAWVRARLKEVGDRPMDLHVMELDTFSYMLRLLGWASCDGTVDPRDARRIGVMQGINLHAKNGRGGGKYPWSHDAYRESVYTVDWGNGSWSVQESQSKL